MALTGTEIKKAKVKEEAYSLSDGGGLYLWITPAGGRLWRWAYRFDRREKLMSLGKYPIVSLAMARERHTEARKLLATGIDPRAQRDWADFLERTQRGGKALPFRPTAA